MIFQILIFGLLSSSAIQAFPSEPTETTTDPSVEKTKTCDEKLAWYRDTTKKTQELFDQYYSEYKNVKAANKPNAREIEFVHNEFKQKITKKLDRYSKDAKKLSNISDESTRLVFCVKEIRWFGIMDQNLTKTAVNVKSGVLQVLYTLGVPTETKDSLDKILSRIVNFLFTIDMTKNLYKDVRSLEKKAYTKTEEGVALEKKYEIKNDEVVETAEEINGKFNDLLADNEMDKEINHNLIDLNDDSEIKAAEERALEFKKERQKQLEEENRIDDEGFAYEERPFEFEFRPFRFKHA